MLERYSLELSTGPTQEPVAIADMNSHLRVINTTENTYVTGLITAARRLLETETRRQLITATWKMYLDDFPGSTRPIDIPLPPLASVTSIGYTDTAGDSQTLNASKYTVDAKREPGRIVPAYGETWPVTRDVPNAVTITFVAGYGGATNVPGDMIHGIKLLVSHWFENREAVGDERRHILPKALDSIVWGNRIIGTT